MLFTDSPDQCQNLSKKTSVPIKKCNFKIEMNTTLSGIVKQIVLFITCGDKAFADPLLLGLGGGVHSDRLGLNGYPSSPPDVSSWSENLP